MRRSRLALMFVAVPLVACHAEPPFDGTWLMTRTPIFSTADCSATQVDVEPVWTIRGDPDAGYRVYMAGTEGTAVAYAPVEEPGGAVVPELSFVMPESWPMTATGPAAAPAIAYRLREAGPDLTGTAATSFALATGGAQEQCNYNWTVSATHLEPL